MKRGAVIVNYKSADWTRQAVASMRAASSGPVHITVVDNSVDPSEVARLSVAAADAVIVSSENVGYGAAVNAALALSGADVVFISNPDVVFRPGAIDELVKVIADGASIVGPRVTWDEGGEWCLPPADMPTAAGKRAEMLAQRSPTFARFRDRQRCRSRIRFWQLTGRAKVAALSGAVFGMRTELFHAVGGFDERFKLYFEEMDLMRRVRRLGGSLLYVPNASCRHAYNQSAGGDRTAAEWFSASEREFHLKWSGRPLVDAMEKFRSRELIDDFRELPSTELFVGPDFRRNVVEASPLPSFETAAGYFPHAETISLPPDVLAAYQSPSLFLRVVTRSGHVLSKAVWRKP